jgi:hypothetical protein
MHEIMTDAQKRVAIAKLKTRGLFCFFCLAPKNDKSICCNSNKFYQFMHLLARDKKLLIEKESTQ